MTGHTPAAMQNLRAALEALVISAAVVLAVYMLAAILPLLAA